MPRLDPDEDEDPLRKCVTGCGRPRWSRARQCRYCLECNPRSVVNAIRIRKDDEGRLRPLSTDARDRQRRKRYDQLVTAGCQSQRASRLCSSVGLTRDYLSEAASKKSA